MNENKKIIMNAAKLCDKKHLPALANTDYQKKRYINKIDWLYLR